MVVLQATASAGHFITAQQLFGHAKSEAKAGLPNEVLVQARRFYTPPLRLQKPTRRAAAIPAPVAHAPARARPSSNTHAVCR